MTALRAHIPDDFGPIPLDSEPDAAATPEAAAEPTRSTRPPPRAEPEPLVITLAEAAALLHISMRTLERMIALGEFPRPIRVGKQRMYKRKSVERWLDEAEAEAERSPRGRRR